MIQGGARPTAGTGFYKAHGLGNDYLVFEEGDGWALTSQAVRSVCDRWRGVGGDGIVLLLNEDGQGFHRARMFNPDGSEFERSGNGLRILGSYLAHHDRVDRSPFVVSVGGDEVVLTVHDRVPPVCDVSVDMGQARIGAGAVGLNPAALDSDGKIPGPNGEGLDIVPVSVGNPHVVVLSDDPTDERLLQWGPFLAAHPALLAGANVQIACATGRHRCRALIWERGVGRTSASGTSACAVAVAAASRGIVDVGAVTVQMQGGDLVAVVGPDLEVVLRGPVEEVCEGHLTRGFLERLQHSV
jgi:diaminopimelate epimerase